MGAEESRPVADSPLPEAWVQGLDPDSLAAAEKALLQISALEPDVFLAARAPSPDLEKGKFNLEDYLSQADRAVQSDPALTKSIDRLVPKRVTEEDFWRLYFCHARLAVSARFLGGSTEAAPALTKALLEAGDDSTSQAIIANFKDDGVFQALSRKEMKGILRRDAEDDEKLAAGIAKAVAKGVVPANPRVEPINFIDAYGKTADEVAQDIQNKLGTAADSGCVLVLQGLSGTGKGTTVAKLQATLPRACCWSNGNVFRALTLLAVSHCEQFGIPFSGKVLTPELLKQLVAYLHFGKYKDKFDIHINGCGHDVLVSEVANTLLKEPRVSKNIPTVAEVTQGEVIMFAGNAAEQMRREGMNVLMEGRAQTLNHVRTPHRFELTLAQPIIIGMRRAAQRMMGQALEALQAQPLPSSDEVHAALKSGLPTLLGLSKALLVRGDDVTSNTIIEAFEDDPMFIGLAERETKDIRQRDSEDNDKLAAGIAKAVVKGVIPRDPPVESTCIIDVLGKAADEVAAAIIEKLGAEASRGCVLVLQGLSGTGKGTTVAKLQAELPNAVNWSNGNVFRSLTLLAVTHCEQEGVPFEPEVLTPELFQKLVPMLEFGKFEGKFDIRINGCGIDALVSKVANTLLKEPRVGKNIPTVAEVTQGEVIMFAAAAAEQMRKDGMNVLMEGRAQTLNYVRTPHRFELVLTRPVIIGMRRAAQRMMAQALERLPKGEGPSSEEVYAALQTSLVAMC